MAAILTCEGVHRNYRMGSSTVRALRGVDLVINEGELAVILGPSGAGKSTLLHVMGGLDTPSEGTVTFRDSRFNRASRRRMAKIRARSFGFVFQFHHLIPELSVLENVMIPGMISRRRRRMKLEAGELLEELGLGERLGHMPSEISGGERQRVAVARAIFNSPDVVFCDEPTGNLDTETGKAIRDLILRLNREKGLTFVVVTHDASFVEMGTRTVRLVDGRIAVEGNDFSGVPVQKGE